MSLNSRTTSLVTTTNLFIILAVMAVVWITHNPLAVLGLFFIQDMPVFQDSVGIDQLRRLGIIDGDDDDDDGDGEHGCGGDAKIGFMARM
jgi:hypothetical protein